MNGNDVDTAKVTAYINDKFGGNDNAKKIYLDALAECTPNCKNNLII